MNPAAIGLIIILIIDGLPARQLAAVREYFEPGGFQRLMDEGALIPAARYRYAATVTAAGHATVMTGMQPARHGLVSNEWYDRAAGRVLYSTEDPAHHYLDEPMLRRRGSSPRNLLMPAFGDRLKRAQPSARVFAASMKDRAAMIMAGREGTAYFYSHQTGRFITSTYYRKDFPAWLKNYHHEKVQDSWFGAYWQPERGGRIWERAAQPPRDQQRDSHGLGKHFPHRVTGRLNRPGSRYYAALMRTPFADEYLADFVKILVREEGLGKNPAGVPDVLGISFSAHDYINHLYGPESLESLDHLLRLDLVLADLIRFFEQQAGAGRVLITVTSDHGFSDTPEHCRWQGKEGGRVDAVRMVKRLNRHLARKFGNGIYIRAWTYPELKLDEALLQRKQLSRYAVEMEAQRFLEKFEGIEKVFSRTSLAEAPENSALASAVRAGRYPGRGGDLHVLQKSCWYMLNGPEGMAANHGTPQEADARVPVIFWGGPFRPGVHPRDTDPADIAPTLNAALGLKEFESDGRVLEDLLN